MEAFSTADDSIELEAKCKEDSSWHPCRVSLSSSGDSLIVHFGSQELEDMRLKKEEVFMHLRYRSMPLQADDCSHIEEGERVLANCKSESKFLFHDAVVEKVDRIRHSKRGCRCTFAIKWLDHDFEGQTLSVPSSSIMKLATKSISAHPIVHTLLKLEKGTDLSYSSPLSTILEGSDTEMDLNKLLQKQVEQISNFADASEKDFPDDILWRNKVLNKEQTTHKHTAESNARVPAVPHPHNLTKRTTRSQTKLQVDVEAKDQSCLNMSIQEESTQNRSYLSPLASRAALASSLLIAKKCLEMDFNSCMTANMVMKGTSSSENLAVSIPLVSKASHVISPPQKNASFQPSSCAPIKVCENANRIPEKVICNAEDRTFAPENNAAENVASEVVNPTAETVIAGVAISRDKKSSVQANFNANSTAPIRLTRSAIRKGAVIPDDYIEVKICTDNKKRRMSGNKKRLNHSAVCQENENSGIGEGNSSPHIIGSDSSKGNIAIPECNVATMKSSTPENTKDASTPCNANYTDQPKEQKLGYGNCKSKDADGERTRTNQGDKRKSVYPNKQDRRVSPRNFLPRTRSQMKSQPGKC